MTIRPARHTDIGAVLQVWEQARSEAVGQGEDVAQALWRSAAYSFDERIARFVRNL